MSNDLLFSIIPREGKVPVVSDDRVKKISKEARAKQLSEDEKDTHEEERLVSEQQQYRVHQKQEKGQEKEQGTQQQPHQQAAANHKHTQSSDASEEDEVTYNSHGETAEHHHPDAPHIDTYE